MVHAASLQELLDTGAHITPYEAVAIVQQLLTTRGEEARETVVTPDGVMLDADGVASWRGGVPSVDAVGCLLDTVLPCGNGQRVPGALRFTIARACGSADAPPFASRAALAASLERFECGKREEVVRELVERSAPARPVRSPVTAPRVDRRTKPNASELRRELRKADERLFAMLQASAPGSAPAPLDGGAGASPRVRWAAIALAAVLGSFAAGYAVTELVDGSPAGPSVAGHASSAQSTPGRSPAASLPRQRVGDEFGGDAAANGHDYELTPAN